MSATAPDVSALPIRSLLVLEELGGGRLGFAMAKNKTVRGTILQLHQGSDLERETLELTADNLYFWVIQPRRVSYSFLEPLRQT